MHARREVAAHRETETRSSVAFDLDLALDGVFLRSALAGNLRDYLLLANPVGRNRTRKMTTSPTGMLKIKTLRQLKC